MVVYEYWQRKVLLASANLKIDVTIFSGFTALSTLTSIIQQVHYATAWVVIKEAQFEKAVESQTRKGLAFGGAAQIVDQVLFFIRKLHNSKHCSTWAKCAIVRILLLQCNGSKCFILVSMPGVRRYLAPADRLGLLLCS